MRTKGWVTVGITVLLGGFIWFNARFVMLAIDSQPDCVPHVMVGDGEADSAHRAARSWC